MIGLVIIGVIGLVVFVMAKNIYNGLVRLRNQVERAWSNIDVILKQRNDEIPQLIQVIEQYAAYEDGLLKQLAAARAHYGQASSISDKMQASRG